MIQCFPTLATRRPAWLRPVRVALLVVGLALLSSAGYILLRARVFQIYEGRAFDYTARTRVEGDRSESAASRPLAKSRAPRQFVALPRRGAPIARIVIPSIGLDTLVLEGDDARTLTLGAGHIPGTALPGEPGNVGIAGHRDTIFRSLRHLRKNDTITLDTTAARYTYRVEALSIVPPSQNSVLATTRGRVLTLVTCYPFYFIGAAPERFIVRAQQVTPEGHSARASNSALNG